MYLSFSRKNLSDDQLRLRALIKHGAFISKKEWSIGHGTLTCLIKGKVLIEIVLWWKHCLKNRPSSNLISTVHISGCALGQGVIPWHCPLSRPPGPAVSDNIKGGEIWRRRRSPWGWVCRAQVWDDPRNFGAHHGAYGWKGSFMQPQTLFMFFRYQELRVRLPLPELEVLMEPL